MKNKYLVYFKAIVLAAFCSLYACKKSDENLFAPGPLSGRTEDQIRHLMTGRWKLHYTVNYSTVYSVYRCSDCYWDFTANDTLTQIYSGSIYAKEKITYSKPSFSPDSWVINSNATGSLTMERLDSLRADTLVTVYLGTASRSYFTKQ